MSRKRHDANKRTRGYNGEDERGEGEKRRVESEEEEVKRRKEEAEDGRRGETRR